MDLLFVLNDLENTVLVSLNGVAHYDIRTAKFTDSFTITHIQRPGDATERGVVAEIQWKFCGRPTFIYSHLLSVENEGVGAGVAAQHFLHRRHRFSPYRYFRGDDGVSYRWKTLKGGGCVLTRVDDNEEVARSIRVYIKEGLFIGEKKSVLRIQPCTVDIDLIVVSFVIVEKKRRIKDLARSQTVPHDEDPAGDGGGSGGVDGGLGEV